MKFFTSMNPIGWHFAEYEPGQRVTKEMISFDTDRADIQVNEYGVVLFDRIDTAKLLLQKDFQFNS